MSNIIYFSKMHGLGNDFIVIDSTKSKFNLSNKEINMLGNRKTGIGFDQLLVVELSNLDNIDFKYRIFNTNGTEVEHCGNGARCFAKFVIDKGLTIKKNITVKIKKGIININYKNDDDIEVDMGKPILLPSDIPFNFKPNKYKPQYSLLVGNNEIPASVLSMGNPHIVFFVSNLWKISIKEMGEFIQQSDYFPESVNVNFVEIIDKKNIELRTFERDVGETDACGTGACASAFATYSINMLDPTATVKIRGGNIDIKIDKEKNIIMSGPARMIFDGQITI